MSMRSESASVGVDLAELIKNHQAGVWRYLRMLGCEPTEADDLTQEAFLAVMQRPFQDYDPAATAAYLRKAAKNLFISARRRGARQLVMADVEALDTAWTRWAGDDGGQALMSALEACLQTLAERARRALDLRFRERRSRADIAASLGLSEDGAKNLMQRAKQHLRDCISRRMA